MAEIFSKPTRSRERWTGDDHDELIAAMRDGLDSYAVGDRLGRSQRAIQRRARLLAAEGVSRVGDRAFNEVQAAVLSDSTWGWRQHLRVAGRSRATPQPAEVDRAQPASAGQPAVAINNGMVWTTADYEALIAGVREGYGIAQLARTLGRTEGAISGRVRLLAPPPGDWETGMTALGALRAALAAPDYDWESRLTDASRENGSYYWSDDAKSAVICAWEAGHQLPALAEQLAVDELTLARHIIATGLADGYPAIKSRLGCDPGGVVEVRSRCASADEAACVWVLVVLADGLVGHVSAHPSEAAADSARTRLLGDSSAHWAIRRCLPNAS